MLKFERSDKRMNNIKALPCLDFMTQIKYEGSISKSGDNSDWDWFLYQDQNEDWVLMEADGPGCIYNFTQHRFPTSAAPEFKFYFDNSKTPQVTLKPCDFGHKEPFLEPICAKYVGPITDDEKTIWVVRNFMPMPFKTHCTITSNIKLLCDNGGGWGHVTYHLYDSAENIQAFSAEAADKQAYEQYKKPMRVPSTEGCEKKALRIDSKEELLCANVSGRGYLSEIYFKIFDNNSSVLSGMRIKIYFDDYKEPFVDAPFGTFFGCEYEKNPAKIETALLTSDTSEKDSVFSNRFPMPFFKNAKIVVKNQLDEAITIADFKLCYSFDDCYDEQHTGYFTSSPYYPITDNIMGSNTVIADVHGSGHMVYGVISGYGIEKAGCEGDVRVFIDDIASPAVESDGSESWASYGWGFATPPQCNPFSGYNGACNKSKDWSEQRLTITDSYVFRSHLRFELEHGETNNGGGAHSGQVFMYMKKEPAEELLSEITPDSPQYKTDGVIETVTNRFENGIHENYVTFKCASRVGLTEFYVDLPNNISGLVLKRVSLQNTGRKEAEIYVDDVKITERNWLFADHNEIYSFLEDEYIIPARYILNKSKIKISIKPLDEKHTECRYRIFAIK